MTAAVAMSVASNTTETAVKRVVTETTGTDVVISILTALERLSQGRVRQIPILLGVAAAICRRDVGVWCAHDDDDVYSVVEGGDSQRRKLWSRRYWAVGGMGGGGRCVGSAWCARQWMV